MTNDKFSNKDVPTFASPMLAEIKNTYKQKNRIIVIGGGMTEKTSLLLQTLKEKYGENIEVITAEEADQRGFKSDQLEPMMNMKITAVPIISMTQLDYKSGKEIRRERRLKERNSNRK